MEEKTEKKSEPVTKIKNHKSISKKVDRVVLKEELVSRIDAWISQLKFAHPALKISRHDLVYFILRGHDAQLSEDEITLLGSSHFNSSRYVQWFSQEVKHATARGETISKDELFRLFVSCQGLDGFHSIGQTDNP